MILILQLKDADWLDRLKAKIQLFAVCKKLLAMAKKHTD
jgi:hypothetical protein